MRETNAILALLPFLVKGALSLIVLRAMRERGFDVTIGYYMPKAEGYTADACIDFKRDDRLLNLAGKSSSEAVQLISETCRLRDIKLLLQIGAPQAYRQIPYVRAQHAHLTAYDILYNPVGHTVNHFLYEAAFDGVLVESRAMKKFVLENTSLPTKSIHVLESGIDLTDFVPEGSVNLSPDEFTLGYVGRMSSEKNPLGFVDLAERLAFLLPGLKFRMFGEGPQIEEVRERISKSPARDSIKIEGYIPHVRDAMYRISCLVVPSKLDGRPNIIMEANACGIPVIGAPVGGIPELISEGINGYIRAPSDADGIATILSPLMSDPKLRKTIQENCRALATRLFDRERMLDDYARVFSVGNSS